MDNSPIKTNVKDKLDPRTIATVIFVGIVEFEIFNPVRLVIIAARRDAWLSIIIGGIMVSGLTWLLVKLATRFPEENYFQYSRKIWGRIIYYIIAAIYLIYWISYSSFHLKNTLLANQVFFLRGMPLLVPAILIMFGAFNLILYGLTSVVRFYQLILPFILLPAIPVLAVALLTMKWTNFLPFLENGLVPVFKGALLYLGFFPGIEIILFLVPLLSEPKKAFIPALIGVNALNFMALVQVLLVIGMLAVRSAEELVWPNIAALELLIIPGFPVERFDLLLTFPWMLGLFTAISLFLYLVSYGIIQVFNLNSYRKVVAAMVTISFIVLSYFIPNYAFILKAQGYLRLVTIGMVFVIPLLTFAVALIRGVRGEPA